MITVYVGDREVAIGLLRKNICLATVVERHVDAETPIDAVCASLTQQPLFGNLPTLIFDGVLSHYPQVLKMVLETVREVHVVEESLTKEEQAALKKVGASIEMCKKNSDSKKAPDLFAFTSWYEKKNKKEAWVAFIEAVQNGAAPEALHGILFWKIKDMVQKKKIEKSKGGTLLRDLALLPGRVRRNGSSLQEALEQFLLR